MDSAKGHCARCGCADVEYIGFDWGDCTEEDLCWHEYVCNKCEHEGREVYKMVFERME